MFQELLRLNCTQSTAYSSELAIKLAKQRTWEVNEVNRSVHTFRGTPIVLS